MLLLFTVSNATQISVFFSRGYRETYSDSVLVLCSLNIWDFCINPIYSSITPVQLPILLGVGS